MEWSDEVKQELGSKNVRLLFEEIQAGRLKEPKIKIIATKMHSHVHGVFVAKLDKVELFVVMKFMLDKWFLTELHDPEVDGLDRIIKILEDEDVGENALAQKTYTHRTVYWVCSGPKILLKG
eukprot:GFUD01133523.1.p1 GENE.GFUD01133523.1~~GFUD01133523.1.p1  ORF type:complete len:122 (-),score=28.77 GFUD01133523.1:134-499(-)